MVLEYYRIEILHEVIERSFSLNISEDWKLKGKIFPWLDLVMSFSERSYSIKNIICLSIYHA